LRGIRASTLGGQALAGAPRRSQGSRPERKSNPNKQNEREGFCAARCTQFLMAKIFLETCWRVPIVLRQGLCHAASPRQRKSNLLHATGRPAAWCKAGYDTSCIRVRHCPQEVCKDNPAAKCSG